MAVPLEAQCTHRAPFRAESRRRLALVVGITAVVMIAEIIGAWLSGSLALLADAGHMFVDTSAIGLALVVSHLAVRPATSRRSYGLLRLEILAALVNGALLLAIAIGIAAEAIQRLESPRPVNGPLLLGIAALGLAANGVGAAILHQGRHWSLNHRGAYLHVLSDLMGSVGVVAAGVIIVLTGWSLADPLVSLFIAALILLGAWRLVRESTDILLEATPAHISLSEVHDRIAEVPGVSSVHDLHVWTVTSGVVAMSGHLVVRDPAQNQRVLETVQERLGQFGIGHVTVQIERDPTCD
jgi:cobalt-zinc-cadmium efflux system protein